MRALSKQRLSKMHAMLDKELQNEQQTLSNHSSTSHNRKERGNFSHLRYTSNLNFDDQLGQSSKPLVRQKQRLISNEKGSLFKKSLEKNERAKIQIDRQSRKQYGEQSSSSSSLERKSKSSSMRGSRKNEINELEKKLLDLEKKMENINLSSSSDEDQQTSNNKLKHPPKTNNNSLQKNISKNSLKVLNLLQNNIESTLPNQVQQTNKPNESTARFSNRNQEENTKQKLDFKSNLPLSHRKNTISDEQSSDSHDEQYEVKYNKFVKVSRQIQNPTQKSKVNQKSNSSQLQDSSQENPKASTLNKSISEQIQRLSIMNKQQRISPIMKPSLSKSKLQESIPQKQHSKAQIAKINTIPSQPERKMTVEHQILQPKYQLQINKNKSKSRSKKSVKIPKNPLQNEKSLSFKNSNRSVKERSTQKKKIERNHTNLDHSFRSDNSAKSKKSVNSLRSLGSKKSLNGKQSAGIGRNQNLEEKKYLKKIENLEKELEHYKRLSKRYETQLSDYKLMQIQFKKMESQFRKSEQIRIQQKKIIQNFKKKAINNV